MVEDDHSIDMYSIYDLLQNNVLNDISKYLKDEAEKNFKVGEMNEVYEYLIMKNLVLKIMIDQ